MTVVIDHERFGERTEFSSLANAQAAIRSCCPEFSGVTLEIDESGGERGVYDERGEFVGTVFGE